MKGTREDHDARDPEDLGALDVKRRRTRAHESEKVVEVVMAVPELVEHYSGLAFVAENEAFRREAEKWEASLEALRVETRLKRACWAVGPDDDPLVIVAQLFREASDDERMVSGAESTVITFYVVDGTFRGDRPLKASEVIPGALIRVVDVDDDFRTYFHLVVDVLPVGGLPVGARYDLLQR